MDNQKPIVMLNNYEIVGGCSCYTEIAERNKTGKVFYKRRTGDTPVSQGVPCLSREKDGRWYLHYEDVDDTGIMFSTEISACPFCGRALDKDDAFPVSLQTGKPICPYKQSFRCDKQHGAVVNRLNCRFTCDLSYEAKMEEILRIQ